MLCVDNKKDKTELKVMCDWHKKNSLGVKRAGRHFTKKGQGATPYKSGLGRTLHYLGRINHFWFWFWQVDHHRGKHRSALWLCGPRRSQVESSRRLGHAVRHAHYTSTAEVSDLPERVATYWWPSGILQGQHFSSESLGVVLVLYIIFLR